MMPCEAFHSASTRLGALLLYWNTSSRPQNALRDLHPTNSTPRSARRTSTLDLNTITQFHVTGMCKNKPLHNLLPNVIGTMHNRPILVPGRTPAWTGCHTAPFRAETLAAKVRFGVPAPRRRIPQHPKHLQISADFGPERRVRSAPSSRRFAGRFGTRGTC